MILRATYLCEHLFSGVRFIIRVENVAMPGMCLQTDSLPLYPHFID